MAAGCSVGILVLTDDEFVFDVTALIIANCFVDGIVDLGLFVALFDLDLEYIEVFVKFVIAIEDMFVDVIDGGVLAVVVKMFDIDAEVFVVIDVSCAIMFGVILLICVANGVVGDMVDGIVFVCVVVGVVVEVANDDFATAIAIVEDGVADDARFLLVIAVFFCIVESVICVGVNEAVYVLVMVNCAIVDVFVEWLALVVAAVA